MIFLPPRVYIDPSPGLLFIPLLVFLILQGCTRPGPEDFPLKLPTESPAPFKLQIKPFEPALLAGSQERLSVTTLDDTGGPLLEESVLWSSNKPEVASIDSRGMVRAHAPGEAVLSAALKITSDAVKIYVFNPPIEHLEIRPSVVKIRAGEEQNYTIFAVDSAGRRLLGLAPEWFSTRPSIATVDSNGKVKGLRAGTARIAAKVDKQMVSFPLRVLSPY